MAFPIMNAMVSHTYLAGRVDSATTDPDAHHFLATTLDFALFNVPAPVDVTGMELAISLVTEAGTTETQDLASGASTLELTFFDYGTTATGASTSVLGGADAFSNTPTGGYTVHQGKKTDGTSTTDLDADDWVALGVVANATGVAFPGAIIAGAAFIYGIPGDIN